MRKIVTCSALIISCAILAPASAQSLKLKIEQITSGSKHHFFGYIGQCQTIPWNATDRYILGMEIEHIDRLPRPEEAATIILVDTQNDNCLLYTSDAADE